MTSKTALIRRLREIIEAIKSDDGDIDQNVLENLERDVEEMERELEID